MELRELGGPAYVRQLTFRPQNRIMSLLTECGIPGMLCKVGGGARVGESSFSLWLSCNPEPMSLGHCPYSGAQASPAKDIPGEDRSHPLSTVLRAFLLVIPACTWSGRILDGGRSLGHSSWKE